MNEEIIQENDLVFLILDKKRRWLVEAEPGGEFHTHKGIIKFDDIIGKPYGRCIFSNPLDTQGYKFYILKPLPSDYVVYMTRKTQIIYPEDAGLILTYSGIQPGSIIIEAGTGSGALSCILGTYVKPKGHIYSYDIREKSLKRARINVKKAKLHEIITIKRANILEDELNLTNVDAIVLDMATPWEAISVLKKYLKLSGTIVSFSPTIEQVKKTKFALKEEDFIEVNTYELLKRRIQVKKNATRPEVRMIGHTGYITFGRKVMDEKNPYRGIKPDEPEFVSLDGMPLRGE
ncbi:MAG: tRNA (adenine-N1)-methyltransferase [Promethearchaeota archaeon]|nr:MAG: tRNA (adenine-N1)-methyltransferase [Candidatus Lokiarchaeota archaeon]